ncbi:hypothetical protein ACQYWQ_21075 [Streptomyces sp. P6-2-1]|uniref:hypothetical protein n=1 Tax=unclassified Streptomyces TaxID=2593676 RepID=UPI003D35AA6F
MTIDPQDLGAEETPADPEEPETFEEEYDPEAVVDSDVPAEAEEARSPLERREGEPVDEGDRVEQELIVEEDEEEYR